MSSASVSLRQTSGFAQAGPWYSRHRARAAWGVAMLCLLAGGLRAQTKAQPAVVIRQGTAARKSTDPQTKAQSYAPTKTEARPSTITLEHRPAAGENGAARARKSVAPPPQTIPLTVPAGTPIQVVLRNDVRIRRAGQRMRGRVAEPIYAFDKLVIPANTLVLGKITRIQGIPDGHRVKAALNADFTPAHKVDMEFSELVLPNGRHIPIRTRVTRGSGEVIQFVSAAGDQKTGLRGEISKKKKEAEHQAHEQWNAAIEQVKGPGKLHRFERYALAELPFHPHYINAGTVYFAELESPLDFGTEVLTPELARSIAHPKLPNGSVVEARLLTPLSSGTAHWGDPVKAIVTKPLFGGKKLIVPEGSLLAGSVLQVRPARRMARNGELRPVFRRLTLPDGIERKVEASLAGLQAGKAQGLKLDAEGGAKATTPKSRYLDTAIAVTLAAASEGDDPLNQGEGGAGGFRLLGFALGIATRSQPLGLAMGAFGASRSIYSHFFAPGRNVVLPKYTAMDITIGSRQPAAVSSPRPAGPWSASAAVADPPRAPRRIADRRPPGH